MMYNMTKEEKQLQTNACWVRGFPALLRYVTDEVSSCYQDDEGKFWMTRVAPDGIAYTYEMDYGSVRLDELPEE